MKLNYFFASRHVVECDMQYAVKLNVISELLLRPNIVRCRSKNVKFCDVWTGQYCTFAKDKDTGDIYAWGLNNYYQLGKTFVMTLHGSHGAGSIKWVLFHSNQRCSIHKIECVVHKLQNMTFYRNSVSLWSLA